MNPHHLPESSAGWESRVLNLNHAMMIEIIFAAIANQNGVRGVNLSQSCAPIHGMGRERMPSVVPKKPKAMPRLDCGTTLEMSDS